MAKEKSKFVVNFTADPAVINQVIANWLKVNNYGYKEKYNTKYYQAGDGIITTADLFEYYIYNNQVIIYAYYRSPKNPVPIDKMRNPNSTRYMKKINQLISALERVSAAASPYARQQGYAEQNQMEQLQIVNQSISQEEEKRSLYTALGALALGIINIIIMFIGYVWWVLIVVGFALALDGIKSNRKLISISALTLNILVVLVFILVKAGVLYI